jgi:hypothetical protein
LNYELKLDLEFYAQFLAFYIAKLKRDWVKKDEEFIGSGPINYANSCRTKRMVKIEADYVRARDKFKKSPEVFEPGYEDKTKRVIRNLEKKEGKNEKRRVFNYGIIASNCQSTQGYLILIICICRREGNIGTSIKLLIIQFLVTRKQEKKPILSTKVLLNQK